MVMLHVRSRIVIKGATFGARGDSCSCDPCDCDPCTCGDALIPNIPGWRVSGCSIQEGQMDSVDVAGTLLLSLALPADEQGHFWQEVLLVDEQVSDKLLSALIPLLEDYLKSVPAEGQRLPAAQRAIYKLPIRAHERPEGPFVQVTFEPDSAMLLQEGAPGWQERLQPWSYDGLLRLRKNFELHS